MDLSGIIWSQEEFTAFELLQTFHDKTPFIVCLLRHHQHQQRELSDILRVGKFIQQLRVDATDATDNSKAYSLPVKECNLLFRVRHQAFRLLGRGYLTLDKLINKYQPPVLVDYTTTTSKQQQQQREARGPLQTTGTLIVGKSGVEHFMAFNYIDVGRGVVIDDVQYLSASKTDDEVRYLVAEGMEAGRQKWVACNELCNRLCGNINYSELTGPTEIFEVRQATTATTTTTTTTDLMKPTHTTSNSNVTTMQQQQQQQHLRTVHNQQHKFLTANKDVVNLRSGANQHPQPPGATGVGGAGGLGGTRRRLDYHTNIGRTAGPGRRRYTLESRLPDSTHSHKQAAHVESRNDVTPASWKQRVGGSQDDLLAPGNRKVEQIRRTGERTEHRDTGEEEWVYGSEVAENGRVDASGRVHGRLSGRQETMDTIHSGKMKDFKSHPLTDRNRSRDKRRFEVDDELDDGSVAETESVDEEMRQMMRKYVDENDNQLLAVNNNNYNNNNNDDDDDSVDRLDTESETLHVKRYQEVEQDNDMTSEPLDERHDVVAWNEDVEDVEDGEDGGGGGGGSNLVRMRQLSLSTDDIPRTLTNNRQDASRSEPLTSTNTIIAATSHTQAASQLNKSAAPTIDQSQSQAAAAAASEPTTFTISRQSLPAMYQSTLSRDIASVTSQHNDVSQPVTYHGTLAIGRPTTHPRIMFNHASIQQVQQSSSSPLSASTTQFSQHNQSRDKNESRDTRQFSTIPAIIVSSSVSNPRVFPTPLNIPQSPPETFKTSVVYYGDTDNDVTTDHVTTDHIHSSVVVVGSEMTSYMRPEWRSRDTVLPSDDVVPYRSTITVSDTENLKPKSRGLDSQQLQQHQPLRAVQSTPVNYNYNGITTTAATAAAAAAAGHRRSADMELDSEWIITSPRQRPVAPTAVRTGKITVTTGTGSTRSQRSSVEVRPVRSVVYDDEEDDNGRKHQQQQQQQSPNTYTIKSVHQPPHKSTSRDQVYSSVRHQTTQHNQQTVSAGTRLVYSQSRDEPDSFINDVNSRTRTRRQNRVTFDKDTSDVIKHGVNSTSGSRRHNDQVTSYPVSSREPVQLVGRTETDVVRMRSEQRPQIIPIDSTRGIYTDNRDTSRIGRKQVVQQQEQWANQPLRLDIDPRMTSSSRPIIVSPPTSGYLVTSRVADNGEYSRRSDVISRETRFHRR